MRDHPRYNFALRILTFLDESELLQQYPLIMFQNLTKKHHLTPQPEDVKEILNFHKTKAKSPFIRKCEVTEFINQKERSMKQKQILYLWFIEIWGFYFKNQLFPPYIFNNGAGEIELKFRIILILACFYDVSFIKVSSIQLNLIYEHKQRV